MRESHGGVGVHRRAGRRGGGMGKGGLRWGGGVTRTRCSLRRSPLAVCSCRPASLPSPPLVGIPIRPWNGTEKRRPGAASGVPPRPPRRRPPPPRRRCRTGGSAPASVSHVWGPTRATTPAGTVAHPPRGRQAAARSTPTPPPQKTGTSRLRQPPYGTSLAGKNCRGNHQRPPAAAAARSGAPRGGAWAPPPRPTAAPCSQRQPVAAGTGCRRHPPSPHAGAHEKKVVNGTQWGYGRATARAGKRSHPVRGDSRTGR